MNILKSINDDGGHPHPLLACPVCGDTNQHLQEKKLTVVDGKDSYQAGWTGRGDLLVIPIEGECGSLWEVCMGEHKGMILIFSRIINMCGGK